MTNNRFNNASILTNVFLCFVFFRVRGHVDVPAVAADRSRDHGLDRGWLR